MKKYGVSTLWSFSRFDAYRNSKYEFFLKYVANEVPLGEPSPYTSIGNAAHDILEKLYSGEMQYENMADEFDNAYVSNITMFDLKFDRTDAEKNDSIAKKYYENLMHFFKHYKKLPYDMTNEEFIAIRISDDIVMQGYIDNFYQDEDGNYQVIDYKTSSIYRGSAIKEHAHQLALYAEGLRQRGIDKDKIKVKWNFLKYVKVKFLQVNGKLGETIVERRTIGNSLKSKAKIWLKKGGFSETQIDEIANEMLVSNGIECLPKEIQKKFIIEDCYVEVDDWQTIYDDLKEEIIETVAEINDKIDEYNQTHDDKIWYDDDVKLKQQSYYLANLSDYTIPQLKDYADYLFRIEQERNAANDLLGVSSEKDFWDV